MWVCSACCRDVESILRFIPSLSAFTERFGDAGKITLFGETDTSPWA